MMLVHRSRGSQACAVGAGQERASASADQVFVQGRAATGNDFVAAITRVVSGVGGRGVKGYVCAAAEYR